MTREELNIGQTIFFGRPNGKLHKGTILKLNPKKALVNEEGSGRWNVPYGMIRTQSDQSPPTLTYSPFTRVENLVMEAICEVYNRLSPENLTCDGEIPYGQTTTIRHKLERQLRLLCQTIERTVTEEQAYEWDRQRAAFKGQDLPS